jgi:hypothetical protein
VLDGGSRQQRGGCCVAAYRYRFPTRVCVSRADTKFHWHRAASACLRLHVSNGVRSNHFQTFILEEISMIQCSFYARQSCTYGHPTGHFSYPIHLVTANSIGPGVLVHDSLATTYKPNFGKKSLEISVECPGIVHRKSLNLRRSTIFM